MQKNKYLTATILVAVFLIAGVVFATETVTLATVPKIVPVSIDNNTHTFKIDTTNPADTEMTIEKSLDGTFADTITLYEWLPFTNNQTFTDTLDKNTKAYYRIKARNQNLIETAYSEPILVYATPSRPQLLSNDRQAESITLTFDSLIEGIAFWVKREGLEPTKTSEVFVDQVVPATKYTYTFWADNNGVLSPENTITLWSLPIIKNENITMTSNQTSINVIINSKNTIIELEMKDNNSWIAIPAPFIINNLKPNTEYEFRIRSKSDNNEYSEWYYFNKMTEQLVSSGGGSNSNMTKTERQQEFNRQADIYVDLLSYNVDGEINSSTAYIDFKAPNSSLTTKITLAGTTKALVNKTSFTNLKDNADYTAMIEISNGEFSTTKNITLRTPNRTPPEVLGLYYDTVTKELIVKLKAISELKGE